MTAPTPVARFAAADATDALVARTRNRVAELLGARAAGIVFGANMTTLTLAFTRAVAATLRPGDRVVGTRLDHDANVTPWRLACDQAGADHVLAPFDPATGILDPAAVIELIDERTRWVALPGASNLIGTIPDLAPIIAAAHDAGARVFVDAVHLAPHRRIDVAALGCDVLATSPYKWYGPHAGVLCRRPGRARRACRWPRCARPPIAGRAGGRRARPASSPSPPSTPPPASCSTRASTSSPPPPMRCSSRSSPGCWPSTVSPCGGRRRWSVARRRSPSPSTATSPSAVAGALAGQRIATWAGHSYAVEVVDQLGLADRGGVVRAGVVAYIDDEDVARLVDAVRRIAAG